MHNNCTCILFVILRIVVRVSVVYYHALTVFFLCAPLACRVAGQSMSVLELLAREIDGGVGLAELVSGIVVKRVE